MKMCRTREVPPLAAGLPDEVADLANVGSAMGAVTASITRARSLDATINLSV